ncbi:MAG: HDIG domain-containing protein [Methylacidiphilales bacterium]|nr:HDIG domain-containing protein [Candidatus Methylacidiphilales bacterium]MDW8349069.1 HDIG domain-containing protein [Verrucomicrobiae bacterium]
MIHWFQRRLLIQKGLATEKQRRSQIPRVLFERLDNSQNLRLLICALFTLFILYFSWNATPAPLLTLSETRILTLLALPLTYLLFRILLPPVHATNSRLFLHLSAIALNILAHQATHYWFRAETQDTLLSAVYYTTIPFAPLLLTVLLGQPAGIFATLTTSYFSTLLIEPTLSFLVLNLISGLLVTTFSHNIRKRSDIVRAGAIAGATTSAIAFILAFMQPYNSILLFGQPIACFVIGIFTAMVVNSLLPLIESLFRISTNISWIELCDLNHPLLRELSIRAPGTYQHSQMVANLAESAAHAIGANGTLCRVMAYFHDIGKMTKPEYFTENAGSDNPHKELTPTMSALIIISHVKEGLDLAIKHKLQPEILDAIQQHHGDSIVYYFYRRALQQAEDARLGSLIMDMPDEPTDEISQEPFRYPGPRPQTKEIAIVSLADAIEGASRSLQKPTPQRIEDLVQDIIRQKINQQQLTDCHLTFNELEIIKDSFTTTLKSILHSRIAYPKHEKNNPSPPHPPSSPKSTTPASTSS